MSQENFSEIKNTHLYVERHEQWLKTRFPELRLEQRVTMAIAMAQVSSLDSLEQRICKSLASLKKTDPLPLGTADYESLRQ
ncbi:hypothetical protein [Leptolyngbya sp. FACHB-261]|uniref:hypothetical protein n=1 Tax=Leptolyngbya sp. FACHB-261 TaxID=2692806 RepID=UPI001685C958|nr:hypothetical protein [Leptolyngbya sp. FACHB-261]MBD2100566.1 hypothetical protein [Leptolyngbya sp. FACHB-261]